MQIMIHVFKDKEEGSGFTLFVLWVSTYEIYKEEPATLCRSVKIGQKIVTCPLYCHNRSKTEGGSTCC